MDKRCFRKLERVNSETKVLIEYLKGLGYELYDDDIWNRSSKKFASNRIIANRYFRFSPTIERFIFVAVCNIPSEEVIFNTVKDYIGPHIPIICTRYYRCAKGSVVGDTFRFFVPEFVVHEHWPIYPEWRWLPMVELTYDYMKEIIDKEVIKHAWTKDKNGRKMVPFRTGIAGVQSVKSGSEE